MWVWICQSYLPPKYPEACVDRTADGSSCPVCGASCWFSLQGGAVLSRADATYNPVAICVIFTLSLIIFQECHCQEPSSSLVALGLTIKVPRQAPGVKMCIHSSYCQPRRRNSHLQARQRTFWCSWSWRQGNAWLQAFHNGSGKRINTNKYVFCNNPIF